MKGEIYYSITVPEGSTLVFSFIGYESQSIAVGDQRVIDVTLQEDVSSLEEIVVIGYGEQRKKEITGAVGSVDSEDFIQGNVGDAAQLIQGKVAGLTVVTPSGDPTENSQILLRGTSTLATGTQPSAYALLAKMYLVSVRKYKNRGLFKTRAVFEADFMLNPEG